MSKNKISLNLNRFEEFIFVAAILVFIISLALLPFALLIKEIDESSEKITLADGFTIEAYNVVLDVNEDNKIDVTENITVNFTEVDKHGIYKFTPVWLEYTGKDEKTIKRKSILSDYRAVDEDYSIDTVNKKERIKIGNPYKCVDPGEKTYVIKYTYNMGKDPFKGFDELIFHAYGDFWGTEIKNASIEVNMPKSIEETQVNFFMDKYRKTNANEFVDYYVDGNTLYANFNKEKYVENTQNQDGLTKSLTVDIELPEGYFVGGTWNYGYIAFTMSLIVFAITILNFINWKKYGKDLPKEIETVEFYPPENYSSAEIGYIYGKQNNKKLTISLIVQLASKGYIKIDEIKKNYDTEIQITNLIHKPVEILKYDDLVEKRVIKIRKLRDANPDVLDKKELKMMSYLFKKSNEKDLKAKKKTEEFLKIKDSLIEKGFIQIVSDNEETRYAELNRRKEEYEESKKQYEEEMAKYNEIISKMPQLSRCEKIVYERLFEKEDVIILSEHKTFYHAFEDVDKELKDNLRGLIYDKKADKKVIQAIISVIIAIVLSITSYYVIPDMDPRWSILYFLSFVCIFVNIFLAIIMNKKTEYGEKMIAKVNGFRNFLMNAEKSELEALVEQNPTYFYNILPYTYVLNISKKWIEKFEDIPMPETEMGTCNFNMETFNSISDHVYYPSSSSGGSGCSSCGGGCSSCGGGCSSCGGGGSW